MSIRNISCVCMDVCVIQLYMEYTIWNVYLFTCVYSPAFTCWKGLL